VQLLILATIGAFLLWFGYSLFFGFGSSLRSSQKRKHPARQGIPGAPRTCPVCSIVLEHGERVQSSAFPSMDGGKDRLMHVLGCPYCLDTNEKRIRTCPVCGKNLASSEYLIARMFEKPGRSHVHVLGCSRCRGPKSLR
jgi:predicted nucleic acid-binding Zn ribbon protein